MKSERRIGFYERYVKRALDMICALLALTVFCWLYAIVAVLVRIKLGGPVIFKQARPGLIDPETGKERLFYLMKFRSMTNERDAEGKLLPDEKRLTRFGKFLRASSLDELPEAINILKGEMSVIGPRPQLVRDMVFMTPEQRMRHTAVPGLGGLAQVKGRNAVTWDEKLDWDLKYIEKVSFWNDFKLVVHTVVSAFIRREGITDGESATAYDYGDVLLREGRVTREEYDRKQAEAKRILEEFTGK
jgi:lipopolysaccharide/colanic/teichoic acid biosynthesis glycosyltransferase